MASPNWRLFMYLMFTPWLLVQHSFAQVQGRLKVNRISYISGQRQNDYYNKTHTIEVFGSALPNNQSLPVNRLLCFSRMAVSVHWQYKTSKEGSWSENLGNMNSESCTSTGEVCSEINDKLVSNDTSKIIGLNGYYRCAAETSTPYLKAHSVRLKLYLPAFVERTAAGEYRPDFEPRKRNIQAKANQSLELPCYDSNIEISGNPPRLNLSLKFHWRYQTIENNVVAFRNYVENNSRLAINPFTGALNFAYVLPTDEFASSDSGTNNILSCTGSIGDDVAVHLGTIQNFTVLPSVQPLPNITVISPPSEKVNGSYRVKPESQLNCVNYKPCAMPVFFGGRFAETGKIRVAIPPFAVTVNSSFHGLWIERARVVTPNIMFAVELYDPNNIGLVYETLYIHVHVHFSRDPFIPKTLIIQEQSTSKFKLYNIHRIRSFTFYHNGKQIFPGSPPFIAAIDGDTLTIQNIRKNESCIIEAEYETSNSYFYEGSYIKVVAFPQLIVRPNKTVILSINGRANKSASLHCSATVDRDAYHASLRWRYRSTQRYDKIDFWNITVNTSSYNSETGNIESTLDLRVTPNTQSPGFWWCYIRTKYLSGESRASFENPSDEIKFIVLGAMPITTTTLAVTTTAGSLTDTKPTTMPTGNQAGFTTPSIIQSQPVFPNGVTTQRQTSTKNITTFTSPARTPGVITQPRTPPATFRKQTSVTRAPATTPQSQTSSKIPVTATTSTSTDKMLVTEATNKVFEEKGRSKATPFLITGVIAAAAVAAGVAGVIWYKQRGADNAPNKSIFKGADGPEIVGEEIDKSGQQMNAENSKDFPLNNLKTGGVTAAELSKDRLALGNSFKSAKSNEFKVAKQATSSAADDLQVKS